MTQTVLLVAVDQGADLKKLRPLQKTGKISLRQVRDIEQSWPDIQDHGQPFRLDHSHLDGSDMLAGDNVYEVEAMFRKDQRNDFTHVYSAHQIGADYFITNNPRDFIKDGRREKLESLMPGLKIRTTEEFLEEIEEKA